MYMALCRGQSAAPISRATPVFVVEEDIATFIIKAEDDSRTLNKTLFMRLPANTLYVDEFVVLWENKIGKTLHNIILFDLLFFMFPHSKCQIQILL
jgi:hypothetical protein